MSKRPLTALMILAIAGVSPRAGAASPTPTPVLGAATAPVPGSQRTLADVARENKLRKEKRPGTLSITGGSEGSRGSETTAASGRDLRVSGPRNAGEPEGRGRTAAAPEQSGNEDYWRSRAQNARDEVDRAKQVYSQEEARVKQLMTQSRTTEELNRIRDDEQKRIGICRVQVEHARRELESLPEEARRAGANPGWVR